MELPEDLKEQLEGYIETRQPAEVFDWFSVVSYFKARDSELSRFQVQHFFDIKAKEERIALLEKGIYTAATYYSEKFQFWGYHDLTQIMASYGRFLGYILMRNSCEVENWLGRHNQVPVRLVLYTSGPDNTLTFRGQEVILQHKTEKEMKDTVEQYKAWQKEKSEFGSKVKPHVRIEDICFLSGRIK